MVSSSADIHHMKIAIVLAVSTYDRSPNLPACVKDSAAVSSLVRETGRFDEVVVISDKAPAALTKERIRHLLRSKTGTPVEELFFYFSGHGGIIDDDFRFILSDFDEEHPNATAISNEELDGWARGLEPQLFVKIVDACNSGTQYIKDVSVLPKSIETGRAGFKHCYFLFSSLDSQSSFASDSLSDFTRALIESVVKHKADSIGYSDLARSVADAFRGRADQTPYFVQQATLTEQFVDITAELRETLRAMLAKPVLPEPEQRVGAQPQTPMSLRERIVKDAGDYHSKEEVLAFFEAVRARASEVAFGGDLAELYSVQTEELSHHAIDVKPAARWLEKQPRPEFFVHILYDEYYVDLLGNRVELDFLRNHSLPFSLGFTHHQRSVVDGYSLREEANWEALRITASPKQPNLPKWQLDVIYAIGPRRCALFYAAVRLGRTGWEEYHDAGKAKWTVHEVTRSELNTAADKLKFGEVLSTAIMSALSASFPEPAAKK